MHLTQTNGMVRVWEIDDVALSQGAKVSLSPSLPCQHVILYIVKMFASFRFFIVFKVPLTVAQAWKRMFGILQQLPAELRLELKSNRSVRCITRLTPYS